MTQGCRLVLLGLTCVIGALIASPDCSAQEQVWVVNFPDHQSISGSVKITDPVPVTQMERYEDILVTPVGRHRTDQLVHAGVLDSGGFSSVVLSLAAEIQGTVPKPAEIGVVLVPDEEFVLRALKEGRYLFPIEVSIPIAAESPAFVAAEPEAQTLAFPRYQVYLYNSGKRTVRAQVYALLRN